MKSLDREKIAAAALVFVGVLFGAIGYLTVVKGQQHKISALDAQIQTAEQQYTALHRPGQGTPALRAAELFQLSRAMPDNDDMPGILIELSRLAATSSVTLTSVAPSPRVALPDGSSAVPLRVTVDGSWPNIAVFLKHIDQQVRADKNGFSVAGRLFDVDAIQVNPSDNAQVEASLTMSAFDYGAPASPTATAGGPPTGTTTTTTTTPSTSGTQQAAGAGSGA